MMKCLAKFTMRASTSPGSCSAVKLKCIRPTPINTTANRSIVHVIRDRIRVSSAQVTSRGAQISSLQLNNRTREYKLLTHFAGSEDSGWIVHSALTLVQRSLLPDIFGDPESRLTSWAHHISNPNFDVPSVKRKWPSSIRCVAITTRRRTAVAIRRRGNSGMPS